MSWLAMDLWYQGIILVWPQEDKYLSLAGEKG